MSKPVFYFEGANKVGKTTLLELLSNDNLVEKFELGKSEKLQSFEWWFHSSSPFELIDELIKLVHEREVNIASASKHKVCLVDKGFKTLSSRLRATFMMREISLIELNEYLEYFKKRYISVISILPTREILLLPRVSTSFGETKNDIFFSKYNRLQRDCLIELNYDFILEYEKFPGDIEYRFMTNYIRQGVCDATKSTS